MNENSTPIDQNGSPEDAATLYSWAKLLGANYREFSTLGLQDHDAAPTVQQHVQDVGVDRSEEAAPQQEENLPVTLVEESVAAEPALPVAPEVLPDVPEEEAQRPAWHSLSLENFPVVPVPIPEPAPWKPCSESAGGWKPEFISESSDEMPSWLSSAPRQEPQSAAVPVTAEACGASKPHIAEGALQETRNRISSRWFALRNVFEGTQTSMEAEQPVDVQRAPVLAIFSMAGGVGKSTIAATLSRALSACGERVLLVETAAYGMLPFYFGAHDPRPGVLRTFYAPNSGVDAPVQMMTVDLETLAAEAATQEAAGTSGLALEINKNSQGASRVIVDLATASGDAVRHMNRLSPTILVPVNPDMNSVVSVAAIDAFFHRHSEPSGKIAPYFLLNQFDASVPLHLDIREALREQLGDCLLPFVVRRSSAVSEALAEGMTVMDYAPGADAAEDFNALVTWLKSLNAPAGTGFGGMRWNER